MSGRKYFGVRFWYDSAVVAIVVLTAGYAIPHCLNIPLCPGAWMVLP